MQMPEWAHLEMEEIDFQVRILQATIAEFHQHFSAWVDFELFQLVDLVGHRVLFQTKVEEEETELGRGQLDNYDITMTIMHTSEPLVADGSSTSCLSHSLFCRFVCANTWTCGEAATFDRRFHAEVDPELLNTFEKLGIPLTEQKAGAE